MAWSLMFASSISAGVTGPIYKSLKGKNNVSDRTIKKKKKKGRLELLTIILSLLARFGQCRAEICWSTIGSGSQRRGSNRSERCLSCSVRNRWESRVSTSVGHIGKLSGLKVGKWSRWWFMFDSDNLYAALSHPPLKKKIREKKRNRNYALYFF